MDQVIIHAEEGEWDALLQMISQDPSLATVQDSFGMTPLHWVCTEPQIPLNLFKNVIQVNPKACTIRNQSSMLPLHVGINSKLPGYHLEALLKASPETALSKDANRNYPSELATAEDLPEHSIQLIKKMAHSYMHGTVTERRSSLDESVTISRVSDYAAAMDELLPKQPTEDIGAISQQLKDLIGQLRQLNVDIQSNSSNSSSRTSSTSSSSSSYCSKIVVRWTRGKKLGLSFEAAAEGRKTGAKVKRMTGGGETDVEELMVGDVLHSINGNPVDEMPFKDIVNYFQSANEDATLLFARYTSCDEPQLELSPKESDALYSRMHSLLNETMHRVSEAEDAVRMSVAMSFAT